MELENVQEVFALSPIQEGMLFHTIAEPGSGVFVEQICATLHGSLNPAILHQAWRRILEHHGALRTIFVWDGLDTPLQVVRTTADLPWFELDWQDEAADTHERLTEDFLAQDRRQGLDLSQAPLMRVTLIRLGTDRWRMIWTSHHLLLDGWSSALVLRDLFEVYAAGCAGKSVNLHNGPAYREFVEHVASRDKEATADFWRARLAGVDTPTRMIDRIGDRSSGHDRLHLSLPAAQSEQLKGYARSQRVTLNTVVLGSWAKLLATYSGDQEVLFGTTVSGRPAELAGIDSAVGLFINTLPIRVSVSDTEFGAWLRAIQAEQLAIREVDHSPLTTVQGQSDIPRGMPLFESIVVFENYPDIAGRAFGDVLEGSGVTVEDLDYREQSNYPLALLAVPGDALEFMLVHDKKKFSKEFCTVLLGHYEQILVNFLGEQGTTPAQQSVLSPAEMTCITETWNQSNHCVGEGVFLHRLIAGYAESRPDHPAIWANGVTLSYRDLERRANRIANTLVDAGVQPRDKVGLCVGRGPDMVAGVLGILKAGAGFVPMDPEYPRSHHTFVANDTGLELILADDELAPGISGLAHRIVSVGADTRDASDRACMIEVDPNDPAYVIHTSGSQGRRKGVVVSHRNIAFSTLARRPVYGSKVDRFLLLSPLNFDSSMVGLFWTLADGGTLVLPEPGAEKDVERIAELIATRRVTHTLCIPSLYALILEHGDPGSLAGLATVVVAGEACPASLVAKHFQLVPRVALFNEYGPTEATVWCVAGRLSATNARDPVPIGRPIPGMKAYVLDPFGQPVPAGVVGGLYVAGPGVTAGYLNWPELTSERFLPDPYGDETKATMYRTGDAAWWTPEGEIVYVGRSDDQIKIRGYRVETGEIAARLRQFPGIGEAAVLLRSRAGSGVPDNLSTETIALALDRVEPSAARQLLRDVAAMSDGELEDALKGGRS